MMKCHFTTIILPYYHMVIKVPFCSWNKCSIFFGITIYGAKKRQMTIFVVGKNLKKNLKSKIIPFLVRVPFSHQGHQIKIFIWKNKDFFELYYCWTLTITIREKKICEFWWYFNTIFFEKLNKKRGQFFTW